MQIQKQVSPGSCVYIHEVVMSRNLHKNAYALPQMDNSWTFMF